MAKNSSNDIISDATKEFSAWELPNMGDTVTEAPPVPTAEELEEIRKAAYEEGMELGKKEGFEFGQREGLEKAKNDIESRLEQFDQIISLLDEPLKQLDEEVESSLVQLTISIVRQLVRREIKTDPTQIVGVVREALSVLPINSRNVRLVLHPDDAELVREVYDLSSSEIGWKIEEDPTFSRGGCRVLSDVSQVDATVESRLASLIAPMLGDERNLEESEGQDNG